MRPRFLADADFNHKIVLGIRRREPSVDFLGACDGGVVGVSDPEVLRIAAESARILVSHDRRTMPAHFARFLELDIGAAIEDLLLIWATTDAEEWIEHLGFVPL